MKSGDYGQAICTVLGAVGQGDVGDLSDELIEDAETEVANLLRIREATSSLLVKLIAVLTGEPKNVAKSYWAAEWEELEAALTATKEPRT